MASSYKQTETAVKGRTSGKPAPRLTEDEIRASRRRFLTKSLAQVGAGGGLLVLQRTGVLGRLFGGDRQSTVQMEGSVQVEPADKEKSKLGQKDLVDSAYSKANNSEKTQIRGDVEKFKDFYRERDVNTSISRMQKYDLQIRDKLGKDGLPSEVADLVIGMGIVESSGDPMQVSPDSEAKGLFQIMDSMAEAHRMHMSDDEGDSRFQVGESLKVLSSELKEAHGRWGDWGFAIWEWHIGAPQIAEIINLWGRDWQGEDVRSGFVHKIKEWGLTVHKLFDYPKIKNLYGSEGWDKTDEYLIRTVAAAELYRENRTSALFNNR